MQASAIVRDQRDAEELAVQRRAWSPSAARRWAARPRRRPRARAGCVAHRWDGCAPRRPRPPRASRACIAGQPIVCASASISARIASLALRQRRDATDERTQVQHRAADQQRHAATRFDVGDGVRGVAHELPRRITRVRLDEVDEVMGHRARCVAASGLALPMSSPRYTCAESTLTISIGNSRASRIAMSLLPVPVGPVRTAIGR